MKTLKNTFRNSLMTALVSLSLSGYLMAAEPNAKMANEKTGEEQVLLDEALENLNICMSIENIHVKQVQIYSQTGELLFEGAIDFSEEIANPYVQKLFHNADFLMEAQDIAYYMAF